MSKEKTIQEAQRKIARQRNELRNQTETIAQLRREKMELLRNLRAAEAHNARANLVPGWSTNMEAAPKDGPILVYYDHDADTYHKEDGSGHLTDYAANAEGGTFADGKGCAVAEWQDKIWVTETGGGYWLPGAWFVVGQDDTVCNPTHWMPLPAPPKGET